jgi:hypothetical protein
MRALILDGQGEKKAMGNKSILLFDFISLMDWQKNRALCSLGATLLGPASSTKLVVRYVPCGTKQKLL